MARYGNTSASSLLRSATAAVNKTNEYNDSIASYRFSTSAQTAQDLQEYQDYLAKRMDSTYDPSKALTLQKTAESAFRTYTSSEIQRQTMAVKYGDQTNYDKYQHMMGLYESAKANGDANLAQDLESQLASLSVTIQNEQQAAQASSDAANAKAVSASRKGVTAAKNELSQVLSQASEAMKTGGTIKLNGEDVKVTPAVFTQIKGQALAAKAALLQQAIDSGLDTDTGTYATELDTLKASSDYVKYANDATINNAKKGITDVGIKIDPFTGARSDTNIPYKLDANGQPVLENKQGDNYFVNRSISMGDSNPLDRATFAFPKFNETGAGGTGGQGYYDQVAGTRVYDLAADPNNAGGILNTALLGKGENYPQLLALSKAAGGDRTTDIGFGKGIGFSDVVREATAPSIDAAAAAARKVTPGRALLGLSGMPGVGALAGTTGMILNAQKAAKDRAIAAATAAANAKAAETRINAANAAARTATSAIPVANPAKPLTFNIAGGTVGNTVGPRAIPDAVKQAANIPGSEMFTKQLYPQVSLPASTKTTIATPKQSLLSKATDFIKGLF